MDNGLEIGQGPQAKENNRHTKFVQVYEEAAEFRGLNEFWIPPSKRNSKQQQ